MSIPTYFSHSYRLEDQAVNQMFWRQFSAAGFSFFVDPPSDSTIHTHLERMMGRCSAFVAVVNRRETVRKFFCSRFILYEYGLSIQARRPRLLLIDQRVGRGPFGALPNDEAFFFLPDGDRIERNQSELKGKIERLREVAKTFPNRRDLPRSTIGVLVPRNRNECAYASSQMLRRIEKAADLAGFGIEVRTVPYEHNAMFALDLDQHEALILDVRGNDLPAWVFAYVYGRLIPSIKLARVLPNEIPAEVPLPPLVTGLRMDEREPGVESVTYWRDTDDLVFQLSAAFHKLDEEHTKFQEGRQGELYFESIGRRSARIFISNGSKANPLARRLAEELRLRNIRQFHYKDPGAIPTGSEWKDKLRSEVQACDVFVALIGSGYTDSKWCMEELRLARSRAGHIQILPYLVDDADARFMGKLQVNPLPNEENAALTYLLKDVQEHLRKDRRGDNQGVPRATLLGASREAIVDAIRYIPSKAWPPFLGKLQDLHVEAGLSPRDPGPVRSREPAEQLLAAAYRAETGLNGDKSSVGAMVELLARLSVPKRRPHLKKIVRQINEDYGSA